jgi:epsilon-lactone hydrolase
MVCEQSRELRELAAELAKLPAAESVVEEREAWTALCRSLDVAPGTNWNEVDAGGVRAAWVESSPDPKPTILYCHGGAFAIGSSWHNRGMLSLLAEAADARVLGVDYRLAPEHPFPAGFDDTLAAYLWLLEQGIDPASLILAGDSCGANLVIAAAVAARDAGHPLPAALACISPWVDLTQSGFSYQTNAHLDAFVPKDGMDFLADNYLAGASPTDPIASPLFADLTGLPPVLIQVGVGECLLADSLALAEALARHRVATVFEAWPHSVHVWPVWASRVPEGRQAIGRIGDFVRSVTAHALPTTT